MGISTTSVIFFYFKGFFKISRQKTKARAIKQSQKIKKYKSQNKVKNHR